MRFLLDTHSFIWSLIDNDQLSKKVSMLIEDGDNEICVSVISLWEISIKYSVGKLNFDTIKPEILISMATHNKYSIIELAPQIAVTSYALPWKKQHKDPFDRMLIWKALQQNFTIISKDLSFHLYSDLGLKLIW